MYRRAQIRRHAETVKRVCARSHRHSIPRAPPTYSRALNQSISRRGIRLERSVEIYGGTGSRS